MKILRVVVSVAAMLLIISPTFANKETLKQGWDAFNLNKRTEALDLFQKAAADADTKAEANLALAMVWWSEDKNEEGSKAFQTFFNSSGDPYPYLYALWTSPIGFDGYTKKKEDKLKFLKKLADDNKANGTLHAMAHSMLGRHYEAMGEFKKGADEYAEIGALSNWQVLGTFDNSSGSGFNKDFGALANAKPDAVFKNKVNADMKWFTPPSERSDRWFDFDYYFVIGNSIMYAQTFLKSDADREVFFRSGNSGSMKIWVNDKLVTNVVEERNCDLDIYINNVKLVKGYNRVLIQIGESETGRANFMLRATDKEGNPVKGISTTAVYQPYPLAEGYTVTTNTLFAEDFFENKVRNEPDNLLNYLLLSDVYLRNDKVYEARKALKKARELAPFSTFVGMRLIEAYSRDNNVTDLTKEYEKIKSNDPDCPYSLKGLIEEARQKENYDEEEKVLQKYKSIYGEDEYTDMIALGIIANRNKYDEVVTRARQLYEKYPDSYELMNLVYTIERNSSKDLAKADLILKAYLKNNYSDKVMTTLAGNYFDLGNKKEGFELYNQRVQNYPYSIGFYTELSDLYFAAQDYDNALKWSLKAVELAPYIGGYWNKVGSIYEAMNKTEDAKDAFRKAIYYTPTNYEARKQLRKLEGKKDLFENFEKADAYDLFKKSPKAEDYPDDNSVILLNDIQRVVYPEGATEEHVEVLVKVFNQPGIDAWKEYAIGYNRYHQRLLIDKAEVLKKDGNKVQSEKNDDDIVFTNLESGDAIHLSYRIENYNTGKLAQHFWDQFNFNFDFPGKISRYSILLPATEQFKSEVLHANIKPVVKDIDDMKLYVWEADDQPAIRPEANMPALSDVGAILDISTIPDWKYVSNWYSDLSTNLAKTDFEIKETVAELFKDKKGLTDLQ
ncbi:MAG: transglutaminase protein, partial [Bacteroidota bacterium]|nr:transglutaminase protein [Bacteroidota bacterium]